MKTSLKLIIALMFCSAMSLTQAQTAEEIVDTYIENIGGQDSWSSVETMKVTGIGRQQGNDYPFVATY
ncbi:MAG: outer membrane lipoprotein-sorting protein, partial [Bacteroidota bacterium]